MGISLSLLLVMNDLVTKWGAYEDSLNVILMSTLRAIGGQCWLLQWGHTKTLPCCCSQTVFCFVLFFNPYLRTLFSLLLIREEGREANID